MNELMKLIESDESVTMYFTSRHIMFELKDCIVVSRLIDGDFIRYDQIFSKDFTTLMTIDRTLLLQAVERVSLIASKDTKKQPVKLSLSEELVVITSNAELGAAKDELLASFEGQPLDIAFNPRFLLDALKAVDEENIKMFFSTALSPCIIKGEDNHDDIYLVLPLRVK